MMAALPQPKVIRNRTPSVQDRTKEFLTLFSKIRNIESNELEETNFSIEEKIHRLLVFYEHYKHHIDGKFINKIIFSKLPNLCFEEHVENSTLLVDVLRTIHGLPPIGVPHLVLFLLSLTHRTLPHSDILRRNELKKGSFSAMTYFLHHAYKKRLTFRNQRLTDMIVCTDPLLYSKLLFFGDTRCTRALLQFGLRFELHNKTVTQIHPIFICAVEHLSWCIRKTSRWSNDNSLERTVRQQRYIEKMLVFSQNLKLLLLSTANPYEITSQIIYVMPRCSRLDDYGKLKSYLLYFFPYEDGETYQPPSLEHMCRYTIRSRLHENWCLPYGIWKLPLPQWLVCRSSHPQSVRLWSMGACLSLDEEERRAQMRSEEIDKQLAELAKQERNVIKILLLGAGESGKSTLVKQMKIIHSDGFTTDELKSFKPTVLDNVLSSMKYVLTGMGILRINLENSKNKGHAQTILSCQCCFDEHFVMLPFIANSLRNLWNDKGVRLAVARGYEYELNDSALYLFEGMDRICSEKYVPTATDVLRARVRTSGIIETYFKINDFVIRMFDVGGQRSERRKWIQCFDDVGALLFVVALSGYDMVLQEDTAVNRLQESLQLFSSICNNRFFINTSMILFLNKLDLFREKILYSGRHLRYYMVDYDGPDYDVDSGALFAQHKFQAQNKHSGKVIYPHFTTATDTSNVQVVFQVVMDTIVRENLKTATLL